MDIKKPLFITILIVAFCLTGIVYIRMTKEPEPVKEPPAKTVVKKKENAPVREVKKDFPAVKREKADIEPKKKTDFLPQNYDDKPYYLQGHLYEAEPYKTVCIGYDSGNCILSARLYAEANGKAVLYKVCGGQDSEWDSCSKNIIAVYNATNKIKDLYVCNPKAPFGQCGNLQERRHYSYDKFGNIILEEIFNGQDKNIVSAHSFTYDSAGRQIHSKECLAFENNSCIRWGLPVPAFDYPPYIFNSFYKPYLKDNMQFGLLNEDESHFIFDKRDNFVSSFVKQYSGDLERNIFNRNDNNIMERYCISKENEKCSVSGDLILDKTGRAVSYRICKYTQEDVCSVEKERKFFFDNYGRPILVFDCAQTQSSDGCKTGTGISFFYRNDNSARGLYTITKQVYCTDFDSSGRCLKYSTGWVKPKETWLYCYAFDNNGNCLNAQDRNKSYKGYFPYIMPLKELTVLSVLKNAEYNEDKTKAVFCGDKKSGVCELSGEGVEFIKNGQGEIEVILKYKEGYDVKTPYAYFIDDGKGNYIDIHYPAQKQ